MSQSNFLLQVGYEHDSFKINTDNCVWELATIYEESR